LVALFNTLARISSSLEAVNEFRTMVEASEIEVESEGHHHILSDRVTKPHNVVVGKPYTDPTAKDFEEHDQDELRRKVLLANATISEALNAELNLVWRVTKHVMYGWVTAPIKM
jgi:ERO1-like protein beta